MSLPHQLLRNSELQRASLVRWCFWGLVLIYAAVLLWRPAFHIIDDHQFLNTVEVGRFIPPWIVPSTARFSPLLAQEYNLISLVSSTPAAFYAFNVLELFLAMGLLVRIGQAVPSAQKYPSVPYLTAAAILLSPAFTISWFRLWVQEKNELVLLLAFLLTYLRFRSTAKHSYFAMCAGFASVLLLTKETAFVPVATIAFCGLLMAPSDLDTTAPGRKSWYGLHGVLLAICSAFLLVYYFAIYRHRGKYLYGAHTRGALAQRIYALAGTLMHDPILVLGLLALFLLAFVTHRSGVSATYRALLLASLALVSAYLVLGLTNTYYLLPAYFAAPYLVTATAANPLLRRPFLRPWVALVFGLLFVNQLVFAAQQVTIWRTAAQDFSSMMQVLPRDLKGPVRTRLFLDGLSPGSSGEMFGSLITNLNAAGLDQRNYDLLANVAVDNTFNHLSDVSDNFSFRKGEEVQVPRAGDLLLVTPADPPEQRAKFDDSAQYTLVAGTRSWSYPNLSLKTLALRALHRPLGPDPVIDPNYLLYRKR